MIHEEEERGKEEGRRDVRRDVVSGRDGVADVTCLDVVLANALVGGGGDWVRVGVLAFSSVCNSRERRVSGREGMAGTGGTEG